MEKYKIPIVSLRYGIVYGEREWYRRVLTIFIKRALQGEDLVIFGEGNQFRDFIYVKDLVEMNLLCMSHSEADGEVFNVGTGIKTSIIELATILIKATSSKIKIHYENTPEGELSKLVTGKRRNPQELTGMCLDSSKALKKLGWKARTNLADGLLNEFEWAKKNLNRWQFIHYTK
jgi:UDP-glucose 4-epimerase